MRAAKRIPAFGEVVQQGGDLLRFQGVMGFDSAQVTAGGVSTREFDSRTLESTISPGLFVCREAV